MFYPINKGIDVVNAEYQSIHDKGAVRYVFDKVQDRNPFHSSDEYKKESRNLKKRIVVLKQIKKKSSALWKERKDLAMKKRAVKLKTRIEELEAKLLYLHNEERSQILLKCAAPCNLVLPGTGDILRTVAYSFKCINAASYCLEQGNLGEIKRVMQTITLANGTSMATQYVYQHIKYLKACCTYSNFKALFTY